MVDNGWVIDRDFGHLTHGYCTTSHASQGMTVDKVLVGIASESLAATDQRTAYVALTRGKEQAIIFTDDRLALLKAANRNNEPVSAIELEPVQAEKPTLKDRLKRFAFARGPSVAASGQNIQQHTHGREETRREVDNAR